MTLTSHDHKTLADGSIDYAHYDSKARALRSDDFRQACRQIAATLFHRLPRGLVTSAKCAWSAAASSIIDPRKARSEAPVKSTRPDRNIQFAQRRASILPA